MTELLFKRASTLLGVRLDYQHCEGQAPDSQVVEALKCSIENEYTRQTIRERLHLNKPLPKKDPCDHQGAGPCPQTGQISCSGHWSKDAPLDDKLKTWQHW